MPRPTLNFLPILAALAGGGLLSAAEPPAVTVSFIDRYCGSCHNEEELKGRLDLESLAYDPANRANLALWVKVHDRVKAGEMPPKEKRRPEADKIEEFLQVLASSLTEAGPKNRPKNRVRLCSL